MDASARRGVTRGRRTTLQPTRAAPGYPAPTTRAPAAPTPTPLPPQPPALPADTPPGTPSGRPRCGSGRRRPPPARSSSVKETTRSVAADSDAGTPRSGTGKRMNRRPARSQALASSARPSSATSASSSSDTTTSRPWRRHERASSSSQSPARGRGMIASRPTGQSTMGYNSARTVRSPPSANDCVHLQRLIRPSAAPTAHRLDSGWGLGPKSIFSGSTS